MVKKGMKTLIKHTDTDDIGITDINIPAKIGQVLLTVVSGGTFGLLGIIFWILKTIGILLWYIFAKIIPFLVVYIGIPTFILGAIMGLFFIGGHLLFIIVFFVGIFIYIRKLIGVVYALPTKNPNSTNNNNNNNITIKTKTQNY
jgi:hypothetical protein